MSQEIESFEALLAEFEQEQQNAVREGEIVSGRVVDFVNDFVIVDIGSTDVTQRRQTQTASAYAVRYLRTSS